LIPGWHAGRIPVVEAVILGPTRVSNRASRLAAAGRTLRLPAWTVTGVKDSFDRPVRSWITVAALTLSVVTVTFVVTAEWTIRQLTERPELIGEPFELVVGVGSPSPREGARPPVDASVIEAAIKADPAVDLYFERVTFPAAFPGEDEELTLAAVGPGYDDVDWQVSRGRLFSDPGEATVGKGFLDATGAEIGDTVEVSVMGKPVRLKVVGMNRVTEDNGRWAMTSVETIRQQVDPGFAAENYAIALRDGESLQLAVERYIEAGSRSIESYDHTAEGIGGVRAVLAGLGAMLLLVGLVSLVNTISIGVRERRRDLGVLKAIGFTPRQLIGCVLSGAFVLTSIALAAGIPLGLWVSMRISDQLGDQLGWGPGLFEMPPATWLACIVPAFALAVALAVLIPGTFAARLRANEALRTE
ncbi:MAG TPA: ABC transporter permease, partial [Sphingomicrobium sp.]|nr:ABC transporter permease [Sphingomicrobium sp.]